MYCKKKLISTIISIIILKELQIYNIIIKYIQLILKEPCFTIKLLE